MLFSGEKLRKSENREKLPQTHKTKLRSRIFDLGPRSRAIGPQNQEKSLFWAFSRQKRSIQVKIRQNSDFS